MPFIVMTQESVAQDQDVAQKLAQRLGQERICQCSFECRIADKLHTHAARVHRILQGGPGLIECWRVFWRMQRRIAPAHRVLAKQGMAVTAIVYTGRLKKALRCDTRRGEATLIFRRTCGDIALKFLRRMLLSPAAFRSTSQDVHA